METSFSYHPSLFADHFDGSSIFSSIGMMEKGDAEGISSCYPSLYSPFADLAVDHTQVNECSYNQPVMNNEDYSSAIVFNFEANDHQVIDKRMTSTAAMISGKKVINDSSVKTAQSNYKGPEETKGTKPKKCRHKLKEAQENKEKANQLPPTGYVFVRARRGQAKDSHSLAERERRRKLSEKMKMLQSLVPGCAMMTNKMKVLEEVIRYVQHLQHTVEFLSMELASANQMSHNKEVHTNCVSAPPSQYAQESMAIPTAFVDDQINFIQPNHFPLLLDSSASNPTN